jgi:hypothetical protein
LHSNVDGSVCGLACIYIAFERILCSNH